MNQHQSVRVVKEQPSAGSLADALQGFVRDGFRIVSFAPFFREGGWPNGEYIVVLEKK